MKVHAQNHSSLDTKLTDLSVDCRNIYIQISDKATPSIIKHTNEMKSQRVTYQQEQKHVCSLDPAYNFS